MSLRARAGFRVLDWNGCDGAVSFTFDDTQPSQIAYWPLIKATGVRCTWYLSPVFRQGPEFEATWKDAVDAGHEIGGHTATHPHTDGLTEQTAAAELDGCDDYIRTVIGQPDVWTMAYPFGETEWKPHLAHRYLFARTVDDGLITPESDLDPLLLPAYLVREGDTATLFKDKIDGAAKAGAWQTLLFHALTPTEHNWYAGVPAADAVASLEYGKTAGVWLDSVINVGSYWLGAKLLRQPPAETNGGLTWTWTLCRGFPPERQLLVTVETGRLFQRGVELAPSDGRVSISLDAGALEWRP